MLRSGDGDADSETEKGWALSVLRKHGYDTGPKAPATANSAGEQYNNNNNNTDDDDDDETPSPSTAGAGAGARTVVVQKELKTLKMLLNQKETLLR